MTKRRLLGSDTAENVAKTDGHTIQVIQHMNKRKKAYGNAENRKYSTIDLFELYWVRGESVNQYANISQQMLTERGIPLRNLQDAKRLRDGSVRLCDLWSDYLNEFQVKLAEELTYLNQHGVESDE